MLMVGVAALTKARVVVIDPKFLAAQRAAQTLALSLDPITSELLFARRVLLVESRGIGSRC